MDNDSLSKELQILENDAEPEEVRKHGKKNKSKKNKNLKIIYFLIFLFFFLLIILCIYIASNSYSINKQMKSDLSKRENRDFNEKFEIFEAIREVLEKIRELLDDSLIDKFDDEEFEHCFKLLNFINTLLDLIHYYDEEDLDEWTKNMLDFLGGIIDYWETNGFEKCFGGGSAKDYLFNCISKISPHKPLNRGTIYETSYPLGNPSYSNEYKPKIYPQNYGPRVNHLSSSDRAYSFCPKMSQVYSGLHNSPF